MKKFLFVLLLPFTLTTYAQHWQDTARAIEKIFARYKAANPGSELAISRNGHLIFSKAWGMADLEHHAHITTTSIIEAGSVSKQFTAAAILLLEQQGKLSLDDDVAKYIPELPEYGKAIPLRYLMHHSSGIRDWGAIAAIAGQPRTTRTYNNNDALDIIAHQQALNFTPNDQFSYSNSNYNLFAIIVERVGGMSLAAFTRKYIFTPAGMTHTSWRDDHNRVVSDRAIAYALTNNVYEINMPNEDAYGNGGLLTTAEDLLKWNSWYQNGHFGNPSLLPKMLEIDTLNNSKPNGYGAGLFLSKRHDLDYIAHDGATASYRARLSSYPALHLSIAWLSNTSAFDTAANAAVQVELLFFPRKRTTTTTAKNPYHADSLWLPTLTELRSYIGNYYSEEAQTTFNVQIKGNQLYLYRSPQTLIPLVPAKKHQFITLDPGFGGEPGEVHFVPGEDGTFRRMLISISRANNIIFSKL
jgi:CubicO group peptidase (beta-lactamase class C family)